MKASPRVRTDAPRLCRRRAGLLAPAGLAALVLTLAGCQTASLEDAAPREAVVKADASAASEATADTAPVLRVPSPVPLPRNAGPEPEAKEFVAARNSAEGEYPNLGTPREAALQQLSAAEAAALKREMAVAKAGASGGGGNAAAYRRRYNELQAIARSHEQTTEQEIVQ
ncbi:hypothetical protein [Pseudohoeflea coraliihabitans]|uniref:DUF3035 domain-containing protein n=1 Tax=Pseudohoeflea coraliihabitans TaxID=2860393 RepID=A0ABS6WSU8_9HYPH|nr:hypothetical protein [Pseudohoeflea sp. DP4N28-3]MBW3098145.1 hypothetical protein [Pseudohoeflea sp. DP4N28-3]